jgi:hypothetical protein
VVEKIAYILYNEVNVQWLLYIQYKGNILMADKVEKIIKYRKISLGCLLISIPMNIINSLLGIWIFTVVGVTLLIASILTLFIFWKCPYCNVRLPWRLNNKNNNDMDGIYLCPHCNQYFKS